ncbi:hypothetical protein UA08_02030 [Talaromyces atroroseus]|uniref:Uncharacterized protein n=1 Tax=Talaromyces atroroseus TaxID=1441469 RepID=A0A1Q5QCH6_TALAT|nr:hypothetical protein UA08_02030 [Talaromyces atroroseus]OKL63549.1 hypothetical protein UA08_02030 [Talaromyces atroroseus]
MVTERIPAEPFRCSIVCFLDAIDYHDDNLTLEERVQGLRYVHSRDHGIFRWAPSQDHLEISRPGAHSRRHSHNLISWSIVGPRCLETRKLTSVSTCLLSMCSTMRLTRTPEHNHAGEKADTSGLGADVRASATTAEQLRQLLCLQHHALHL